MRRICDAVAFATSSSHGLSRTFNKLRWMRVYETRSHCGRAGRLSVAYKLMYTERDACNEIVLLTERAAIWCARRKQPNCIIINISSARGMVARNIVINPQRLVRRSRTRYYRWFSIKRRHRGASAPSGGGNGPQWIFHRLHSISQLHIGDGKHSTVHDRRRWRLQRIDAKSRKENIVNL